MRKRFFLRLASALATSCLAGVGLAAANPALPPCTKFPSGRVHIYPWTATLANGAMSAALPSHNHYLYYFDLTVSERDVQTDVSIGAFSIIVPPTITGLSNEYRLTLFDKAEHANGRYYFSGVYEYHEGKIASTAHCRDTLEIMLSARFCFDAS